MGKSDLFRRTLEAGTSFLDMSRERAEAVVKEWVDAGDLGKGRAQRAIDDVLERSRKATDDLRDLVRKEIQAQLESLGVATRADIERLEAKLDAATAAAATGGRVGRAPAQKATPAAKAAPATKAAPAAKATPAQTATPARKATAAKKTTAARKATKTTGAAPPGPGT